MKRLLVMILSISISFSAFAEEPAKKTGKRYRLKHIGDVKASADRIRAQEPKIREFYTQLVLRKAQMDIVTILNRKNMDPAEIEKIVLGPEMKLFLSRLAKHPKIQAKVDMHVKKLLKPGLIEEQVMKRREMLAQKYNENLITAYLKTKNYSRTRYQENVLPTEEPKSLLSRAWDHMVKDLYKN